jgi:surfactin synthase thioesterase subunit
VSASTTPWLLRRPAADTRGRLFCFPYLGTGASMYHRWPRLIDGIEVCPVQLPGRENRMREPPYASYEGLAAELVEALADDLAAAPYAFFGHCASAYIGYEAALALAVRGGPAPAAVVASSMVAPHESSSPVVTVLHLDDDQLPGLVEDTMRARGADPTPEIVELALDSMRADLAAYRRYHRAVPAPLECRVVALAWALDEYVPAPELEAWRPYGDVRIRTLPGDHWSFLGAPPALQAELARALDVVRDGSQPRAA